MKRMLYTCLCTGILVTLAFMPASGQFPSRSPHPPSPIGKPSIDDYRHFHNVGNLGLTVTNYGVLGQGYLVALKEQPSCQYKLHSRLDKERIEHFSYAGLWVGGIGGAQGENKTLVSTAIVDGVFTYGESGFEFTTSPDEADSVRVRSTIITSPHFHPAAISHQDFLCDFTDRNTSVPGTQIGIPEHTPLGIDVHLESYAWNYSFADAFVILNYTIKNISSYRIEKVHVGLWVDASVANMNYTSRYEPGGGFTWYDNLNGFDEEYNMAYQYDADGDNGYAESYLGIRALGASVPTATYKVNYNQWKWATATNVQFPDYFMPRNDEERYQKMATTPPPPVPDQPDSWMILLSMGPLGDLAPGDSLNAVFAVVCGFWGPGDSDSPERRKNLRLNSDWAQIAYNGEDVDGDGRLDRVDEDVNGNGILDLGEDLDGDGHLDIDEDVYHNPQRGIYAHNGRLDRYILPSPPPSPRLLVIPGRGRVELRWDDLPELTEDPITREIDFEGYRIYGSPKTRGSQEELSLLAQFDLKNNLGYDTGLDLIRHDTLIDGRQYRYRFVNEMLHDGWPGRYFYSVTAFDRGNPTNNLPSLESSVYENLTHVIPGTPPSADELKVYVYPNPYRGSALWDGSGERQRLIWFANLPAQAVIRIYTLAGDLVDEIHHDSRHYAGQDVTRLAATAGGKQIVFPGGLHAWDLITRNDQAIASGLYLYTVEDKQTGQTFVGKFLVIK
ncbi:MAG: hypothetical protein ACUVWA_00030 [Candidatus Oleimicrobiaceae bacterium]